MAARVWNFHVALGRTFYFDGIQKRVFHTFGIKDALLKILKNVNVVKPTAIQEKSLGPVLEGKNTVINAETGSGKTLCYLLPIINKLLANKELLSRPPFAVVLLPSIELCQQVANVFQSLSDNAMQPCIVHRESKLLITPRHPIILATPNALFNYTLSSLDNVQVVVVDEADLLLSGGGDEIWEILCFFKGVDSLKMKKQQKRLAKRQRASRERNTVQGENLMHSAIEQAKISVTNISSVSKEEFSQQNITTPVHQRQFVFVAATLPQHGPKSVFNVLKEWLPDAEFVSTDLAHYTVPTVGISYMGVHEANKLPELLRCLNALVGIIENPLTNDEIENSGDEVDFGSEKNVSSGSCDVSETGKVDSLDLHRRQNESRDGLGKKGGDFFEPVSLANLRVLVFANSAKATERAFNFLSDINETEESVYAGWKHVTRNDVTITTGQVEEEDDSTDEDTACHFVTHTGNKDIWIGLVGLIHKGLSFAQRTDTLNKFKSGELKVLICTDLASRGLDIQDVSHVIQLDFAPNAAAVLHRTGRTARAGASGKVINFITEHDEDLVMAIQAHGDNPDNSSYQPHFSRNRQFRRRIKKKQQRQINSQAKEH